jgi:transglutaminase-like putative cysteine protease
MRNKSSKKLSSAFAKILVAIMLISVAGVAVSCGSGTDGEIKPVKKDPIIIRGDDVQVNAGDEIDYNALVSVTDLEDPNPTVDIDHTSVDLNTPGTYQVVYKVQDSLGNSGEYTVNITVLDVTPPEVTGSSFTIMAGESVSYKKQIQVSDDCDPDPVIDIDNSQVDLDTPGVYSVLYTVTDASGNSSQLTLEMTVLDKIGEGDEASEQFQEMQEYVLDRATSLLESEITEEGMTDMEKAFAIYRWTKYNIAYSGSSDKTNYIVGAYDGFKKMAGDCYTYFAVSKALLNAAGIDNVDVVKERIDDSQSRHYWSLVNVGDGWYHFDSTPYSFPKDNFFMVTDEELKDWDDTYYAYCHNFLSDGLPERETESIQYRINYGDATID